MRCIPPYPCHALSHDHVALMGLICKRKPVTTGGIKMKTGTKKIKIKGNEPVESEEYDPKLIYNKYNVTNISSERSQIMT